MSAADLLADFVRFPTQQAGADGKAGNERALCEHLVPLQIVGGLCIVVGIILLSLSESKHSRA